MSKPFDKMIKSELEEAAAFLKLDSKVKEVAKDANKPTNAEYVKVLEEFKVAQDLANPQEAASIAESRASNKSNGSEIVIDPKSTPSEERATKTADYFTMVPVIVTDHDTSVSVEDDVQSRTVAIRWGSPVLGMTTVNVPIHGRMQYLQKGAIIRLRRISLASNIKDADGKEVSNRERKRFSVADTTGWTEAEFEAHAKEQALKKIK